MEKESMIIALLAVLLVALIAVAVVYEKPSIVSPKEELKKFSSYEELKNFVKTNIEVSSGYYGGVLTDGGFRATPMVEATAGAAKQTSAESTNAPTAQGGGDYSQTNIQVEGVDEADFVKNDGKYIYTISGGKVVIMDAYPAENAKILSEIELNGTPQEIFINKDKLIVFGWKEYRGSEVGIPEIGIVYPRHYSSQTFVKVFDITDRSNPVLKRDVSADGNYFDSRMIGNYVYVIVNDPVYFQENQPIPLPVVIADGTSKMIEATDIYYFDFPDSSYIFTNILAVNTQNDEEEITTKTFLMGYSENMYVSTNNIYIVYTKRLNQYDFYDKMIDEVVIPNVPLSIRNEINSARNSNVSKYEKMGKISKILQEYIDSLGPEEGAKVMKEMQAKMEDVQKEIAKEMEKTIIHKISINGVNVEYGTSGEVPGYVLNQFSMDEYNNYFRIATTTGSWRSESLNHVYVLDDALKITGKLEDLAHGEKIYSVRFMGDKGYLVTFRQIDPLFVIDLSNPTSPAVLGFLKIPGVSDYLHPYDETHIIGVGRDATEQGRVQGMKLSLFDISDVSNPKEISKYMIGERGTYSEALNDHKAFLFSKSNGLLVIPISLAEKEYRQNWQGAYVFNVDLVEGFTLKGRITHVNETANKTEYYYDWYSQIRRSLYIDNVLYTVSGRMVKMNDLGNLQEINKVELPTEPQRLYGIE